MRVTALIFLLAVSDKTMAELPKTVAETSNYRSTSHYADVMAFLAAIQRADPDMSRRDLCHDA